MDLDQMVADAQARVDAKIETMAADAQKEIKKSFKQLRKEFDERMAELIKE